jgi:hypothetical protein
MRSGDDVVCHEVLEYSHRNTFGLPLCHPDLVVTKREPNLDGLRTTSRPLTLYASYRRPIVKALRQSGIKNIPTCLSAVRLNNDVL